MDWFSYMNRCYFSGHQRRVVCLSVLPSVFHHTYVYLQPVLTYWLLEIFSFDVYSGINCFYKLLYSCVESFNGDNSHQMTVSDWLRCRLALIMMCISVCVLIFPVSTCSKWKKSLLVSGVWWLLLTQLKAVFPG